MSLLYCSACRCYIYWCCFQFNYYTNTLLCYWLYLMAWCRQENAALRNSNEGGLPSSPANPTWLFDWLCGSLRGRRWHMWADYFTCPPCSHTDGKCKIWPFEEGQLSTWKWSGWIIHKETQTDREWWVQRSSYVYMILDIVSSKFYPPTSANIWDTFIWEIVADIPTLNLF